MKLKPVNFTYRDYQAISACIGNKQRELSPGEKTGLTRLTRSKVRRDTLAHIDLMVAKEVVNNALYKMVASV